MSEKRNPKFVSALRFYRSVEILEKELKMRTWVFTGKPEKRREKEKEISYVLQTLQDAIGLPLDLPEVKQVSWEFGKPKGGIDAERSKTSRSI